MCNRAKVSPLFPMVDVVRMSSTPKLAIGCHGIGIGSNRTYLNRPPDPADNRKFCLCRYFMSSCIKIYEYHIAFC